MYLLWYASQSGFMQVFENDRTKRGGGLCQSWAKKAAPVFRGGFGLRKGGDR